MTLPVIVIVLDLVLIIALSLAYLGATVKATVLQVTVDNPWPILQALGRAIDAEGKRDAS